MNPWWNPGLAVTRVFALSAAGPSVGAQEVRHREQEQSWNQQCSFITEDKEERRGSQRRKVWQRSWRRKEISGVMSGCLSKATRLAKRNKGASYSIEPRWHGNPTHCPVRTSGLQWNVLVGDSVLLQTISVLGSAGLDGVVSHSAPKSLGNCNWKDSGGLSRLV